MNVLLVDDGELNLSFKDDDVVEKVDSKIDALCSLVTPFDLIIINSKFNSDFVSEIRKINKSTPIYLVDVHNEYIGLSDHSHQINGYFTVDKIGAFYKTKEKFSSRLACQTTHINA